MTHDRLKFARDGQSAPCSNTLEIRLALIVVSLFLLNTAGAQTKIHKCTDADGGVSYSQLPCAPQESVEQENNAPGAKVESERPEPSNHDLSVAEVPHEVPERDTDRSECKKRYRDAIDAIDAEIGRDFSADKAEQYKQQLLLLTRKLRQC